MPAPDCHKCIEGYYMKSYVCSKCHDNCRTCTNYETCIDCISENRDHTKPKCPCRTGYYAKGLSCEACDYSCVDCTTYRWCTGCYGNRTLTWLSYDS